MKKGLMIVCGLFALLLAGNVNAAGEVPLALKWRNETNKMMNTCLSGLEKVGATQATRDFQEKQWRKILDELKTVDKGAKRLPKEVADKRAAQVKACKTKTAAVKKATSMKKKDDAAGGDEEGDAPKKMSLKDRMKAGASKLHAKAKGAHGALKAKMNKGKAADEEGEQADEGDDQ